MVSASYKIEDLESYFNIKVNLEGREEIDTVGGMLFNIANKVPKNNQTYNYKDILGFKVVKATPRRIELLEIRKID